MRTTVKWVAFGSGVGCVSLLARAMVANTAGLLAAVLSDFEARRTEVPPPAPVPRRTQRATSTKLPPRLKADIEYTRAATATRTISLVESPAPIPR